MKRRSTIKTASIAALLSLFIVTGTALAYDGWGRGHHRGGPGMSGPQDCPAWSDEAGPGRRMGLSEEDALKFQEKRTAFFEATRALRGNLYQKGLELRSELAKADPDVERASEIQAEISSLRSELDQKRLAHRMEMRKLFPDAGPMMGSGYGRHHGKGRHGMRGSVSGQGGCWR